MTPERRDLLRLELPLGALALTVLAAGAVFAVSGIPAWIPPALSVRFGLASPLTGMTRSVVALMRGDVAGAFGWHPLGPLVVVAAVAVVTVAAVAWVRGRRLAGLASVVRARWLWYTAGAVTAAVWVRQIVEIGA